MREVNIGRASDFADRRVDVRLAEATLAAQAAEGRGKAVGEAVEHVVLSAELSCGRH